MLVAERRVVFEPERPAPDDPAEDATSHRGEQLVTALIVFTPLAALLVAVVKVWGWGVSPRDLLLALAFYAVTGHGITVGFHRLFTHRSFQAVRPVRVALAVAGSMAFEGPVIGWVADHRRHHAFTDVDGDPHSPHLFGRGPIARLRGLWHAHTGWLFEHDPTPREQYARDLVGDRDLVRVDRLFPLWCTISLALPFGLGWLLGGTLAAGGTALLWAGAVRICLLHHVTWSINSLCHTFGRRPYPTADRSTNLPALAVLSMGESFHNTHHAFPNSARHGLERRQLDSSAALIGWLARRGWARDVRQPDADRRRARAASS
ncbi:MAG: acyl-CoA desaturase [Acidimicrobiia bacterium]|nr:acyl-CoA desaturase [Acidimicrobiia bacterium]